MKKSRIINVLLKFLSVVLLLNAVPTKGLNIASMFKSMSSSTMLNPSMQMFEKLMDNKSMEPFIQLFTPDMGAKGNWGVQDISKVLQQIGEHRSGIQIQRMLYSAREVLEGPAVAQAHLKRGTLSVNKNDIARLFIHVGQSPHAGGVSYLTTALAFISLDRNNNGQLSPSETRMLEEVFKVTSSSLESSDEARETISTFDDADTDHDGQLSFREFYDATKILANTPAFAGFRNPDHAQFLRDFNGKIPDLPQELKDEYKKLGIATSPQGMPNFKQLVEKTPALRNAAKRIPGGMEQLEKLNEDLLDPKKSVEEMVNNFKMPELPKGMTWEDIGKIERKWEDSKIDA
eukprot:Platyproteum_vivax@DN16741_c0_g1_i1.p1